MSSSTWRDGMQTNSHLRLVFRGLQHLRLSPLLRGQPRQQTGLDDKLLLRSILFNLLRALVASNVRSTVLACAWWRDGPFSFCSSRIVNTRKNRGSSMPMLLATCPSYCTAEGLRPLPADSGDLEPCFSCQDLAAQTRSLRGQLAATSEVEGKQRRL